MNICHLCLPMYRKVAIRQAFFVFRVAPCSSKFTGVVRCSPVHFSSFLDFSKKGNKNIFHLPPILALFRAKTHLQSNRESKQNISHLPEMYSLGKTIKKRVLHPHRFASFPDTSAGIEGIGITILSINNISLISVSF